ALVLEGRRWTYREVNEEANRLARVLQKRGLGEGSLVGILLERSAAMVTALLAVLKAGAAYVPLDPAYPPERIRFVQEDAGLTGIIAEAATRDRVPDGASNVVVLEECAEIAGESRENLPGRVSSEQRAYVIYTSGSTGTPKGVEGTHRGAMNRFSWMWRTYPFQADEVCCQKTNLGFVDSIWEIFGPLLAGIANVILPPATVRDPEQFLQVLAEEGVSRIVLVPSQLRALLEHAPKLGERVPGLKLWSCSGEALPGELAKRFAEAFPGAKLLNIYGCSEVAADASWHEVEEGDDGAWVPIGKPISNTQIYVVDEYGNPVPVGVRGEIYVGGEGLARGYLNRGKLTGSG